MNRTFCLINEQKDLPLDSIPLSTLFITLIICLVLSAYFSGSETGLLSLNKYRLRFMAEQGNKGAQKAEKLLEKPDTLLSFILIFNNLVNISASAIATMIGMRLYGDAGVAIATGLLTFVMLVFSEISLKPSRQCILKRWDYFKSYLGLTIKNILSASLVNEYFHENVNANGGFKTRYAKTSD